MEHFIEESSMYMAKLRSVKSKNTLLRRLLIIEFPH